MKEKLESTVLRTPRFPMTLDALQTFAGFEDESEEDDPNEDDDEIDLNEDDQETDEPESEEDEEPETDDESEEEQEHIEFTPAQQKKIDELIQQRLGRNNSEYAKKVRAVESATGMDIDAVLEQVRQNKVEALMDQGLSEEEARKQVDKDRQLAEFEEKQQEFEQQQREFVYNQQKGELAKNPHVKQYMADIDAFSQNGAFTDFDTAAKYIIGAKVLSGELLDSVRQGAEKRTIKNMQQRKKVTPEKGKGAGASSPQAQLSRAEREMAEAFGLDPKEVAKSKEKIKKGK